MTLYNESAKLRLLAAPMLVFLLITQGPGEPETAGGWHDDNVTVIGNQELSGNSPGVGTVADEPDAPPAEPVRVADPYIYDYRDACTDGDSRNFEDCISVVAACSTGGDDSGTEPGTVLYLYKSRADITPSVWTFDSGPHCVYSDQPADQPAEQPRDILAEIAGLIAHEFQQTPIAAADFGSQPGPHTLRGKETNVWAEASTQTFNLTLLGQNVTITATPVAYTWDYGDGTTWGPTPVHGAPLHEDRIGEQTQTSHAYTETGEKYINLITHFNGSYTVNGGPELPIPGQGNIPSPQLWIKVWRAETHLYADNCFQNPQGIGC